MEKIETRLAKIKEWFFAVKPWSQLRWWRNRAAHSAQYRYKLTFNQTGQARDRAFEIFLAAKQISEALEVQKNRS